MKTPPWRLNIQMKNNTLLPTKLIIYPPPTEIHLQKTFSQNTPPPQTDTLSSPTSVNQEPPRSIMGNAMS